MSMTDGGWRGGRTGTSAARFDPKVVLLYPLLCKIRRMAQSFFSAERDAEVDELLFLEPSSSPAASHDLIERFQRTLDDVTKRRRRFVQRFEDCPTCLSAVIGPQRSSWSMAGTTRRVDACHPSKGRVPLREGSLLRPSVCHAPSAVRRLKHGC